MITQSKIQYTSIAVGIAVSIGLPAFAQNIDHSLGPIRQAQSSDPAGFTLMVFCIGLLVFMVLGLFIGTMFYFMKGQKKQIATKATAPQNEAKVSTD